MQKIRKCHKLLGMLVLGLESTCDETACSIVVDGRQILSNVVSSQVDLHAEYGGVVPELACRRHIDIIIPVIEEALSQAQVTLADIDLIAVAHGPGLIGALLIGLNTAKALSLSLGIPFIGVNHIEAHLYATLMSHDQAISFPALGVILSGGHTALVQMQAISQYTLIAETVDDAVGEAFDKVAKILGLPYPGGPQIEALARQGNPLAYPFKSGQVKTNPLSFSFSGLKTAVLYATQKKELTSEIRSDIAASFQDAAFRDIIHKTKIAAIQSGCQTLLFGGGVTNNQHLRKMFAEKLPELQQFWPSQGLSLDNAAMIAGLGYHVYKNRGCGDTLGLEATSNNIWTS